jgi:hypothetical protein
MSYLWIRLVVVLLRPDPPGREMVLDSVGEGKVKVLSRRLVSVPCERVVQVAVEGLLYVRHVLHGRDRAYRDLLAPLLKRTKVCLHFP